MLERRPSGRTRGPVPIMGVGTLFVMLLWYENCYAPLCESLLCINCGPQPSRRVSRRTTIMHAEYHLSALDMPTPVSLGHYAMVAIDTRDAGSKGLTLDQWQS